MSYNYSKIKPYSHQGRSADFITQRISVCTNVIMPINGIRNKGFNLKLCFQLQFSLHGVNSLSLGDFSDCGTREKEIQFSDFY